MKKDLYTVYEGDEILRIPKEKEIPLVEGLMDEDDYILLAAEKKCGKTVFAQQLACSLTSGTPLFGVYEVPRPVNVWYFVTEGKDRDIKDRFIRMSHYVPLDTSRLKVIPSRFRFNTNEGKASIMELLLKYKESLPKVIIIDALYRAIKGSVKSDDVVNEFHHIVGWMVARCNAAVLVVHHMTKPQRSQDGNLYERTDDDIYGSAFLGAAADSVYWLEKWKKDKDCKLDRLLRCDTQRSGSKIDKVRIRMMQPDPLYYITVSKHSNEKHKVYQIIKVNKKIDMLDIMQKTRVGRNACYEIVKELKNEGVVDSWREGKIVFFKPKESLNDKKMF